MTNQLQPDTGLTLRRAKEQDAEAIVGLTQELGYPGDVAVMSSRITAVSNSPSDALFVAVDVSTAPVGWLHAHSAQLIESGFRVEILGLVVSPAMRRLGVGRMLVAEAERWATILGAEVVVVRSNVTRNESRAFYPAIGYQTTKTQHVYRKTL
jgi:GNAT superfamily N-acetyltransferase